MCGIFGVIKPAGVPLEWVEQLGRLNTVRGNVAFGGLTWTGGNAKVFRFNHPFDLSNVNLDSPQVVLGHIRAPTGGQTQDIRGVHPFETPSILLAHNGILLNHVAFQDWQLFPDVAVDSQIIAGGIEHFLGTDLETEAAIVQVVSQLEGQQGCWLWDKREPCLFLWRVMSSLFFSHEPGCLVFSSVKCDLAKNLLPEGQIYQIDPAAQQFEATASFPFYSPYKIVGANPQ